HYYGILFDSSYNNSVYNCNINNSSGRGILISYSYNNSIYGCGISNNWDGILFDSSCNNSIYSCNIKYNGDGIIFWDSDDNSIHNCDINNSSWYGIRFTSSNVNSIYSCTICNNGPYGYGLRLDFSRDNYIYHNNFINNYRNVYDNGNNTWDNSYPFGGNYWSNFDEPSEGAYDNNSDGIVDSPYHIPGGNNVDRCPLVHPITSPPVFIWVDDDFNSSTPGWQYDHFSKIQDGIDAVAENGTVYVFNGTYYENVVVNKRIILIGEDRDTTIIDGMGKIAINLSDNRANYLTISDFTVRNSSYGLYCKRDVHNNFQFNTITNNIIEDNTGGIWIWYGRNNVISHNQIHNNSGSAIAYTYDMYSTIHNNTIVNNYRGIGCYCCCGGINGTLIRDNYVANNKEIGIIETGYFAWVYMINNTVLNNSIGISLYQTLYDRVMNNTIQQNRKYNIAIHGKAGYGTHEEIISGNIITGDSIGIYIDKYSYSNLIYNNYFNNTINVVDNNGTNIWNISKTFGTNILGGPYLGGNYWSDYTGADTNGDGIGDTNLPYNCSGNIQNGGDWLPLVEPNYAPTANFSYWPLYPKIGQNITFDASSSYDSDGSIVNYTWNFGDGSVAYGKIVTHSYAMIGRYDVTLVVRDNDGATDSITKQIRVIHPPYPWQPPELPEPSIFIIFNGSYEWNETHWVITDKTKICFDMDALESEGIVEIFYQIDDNGWGKYENCFNMTIGRHFLYCYGKDEFGFSTHVVSIFIEVRSNLAPTTDIVLSPSQPDGNNGWYRSIVTISFNAYDDAGIKATYYKIDNGKWREYRKPIAISNDGKHIISFYSIDGYGNKEREKSMEIKIDRAMPQISFKTPVHYLYIFGRKLIPLKNTIIIGKVFVAIDANDNIGIEKIEFYVDGELKATMQDKPYSWQWNELAFGMHEIMAIAYDEAGNIAITREKIFIFLL
ncbi:MAG: PKD domain-containing protein, partial [Thermoplasmata archaeon]